MHLTKVIHLVFHLADLDGIGSALTVIDSINQQCEDHLPEFKLYPWNYGMDVPVFTEKDTVIMVDMSFPPEDMVALNKRDGVTIWIDHHKTAIDDSVQYGYNKMVGSRQEGIAAIKLAWNFFNEESAPEGLDLLAEYDVWDHSRHDWQEEILPFQFGMRNLDWLDDMILAQKQSSDHLYELAGAFIERCNWFTDVIHDGTIILKYQEIQNKMTAKRAFCYHFEGVTFAVINGHGNSDVFKTVDFSHQAVMFFNFKPGLGWRFSLYSSPCNEEGLGDLDLSVIAKKFGGGGHRGAAGFVERDLSKVFGDSEESPAFNIALSL